MLITSLFSLWMCAPLAPLNPLEQDTVNAVNMQFSVGLHSPSEILRAAPEMALRYEMLTIHPLIIRFGAEYKDGSLSSTLHPQGPLQTYTISMEALYYRGTRELTGFFGAGPLYTFNSFTPNQFTRDSLSRTSDIDQLSFKPTFGYRLFFGARYMRRYSIEVRITETYPRLEERSNGLGTVYAVGTEKIKTSSISLTFGYLFKIK
jgi:hypothetical protein